MNNIVYLDPTLFTPKAFENCPHTCTHKLSSQVYNCSKDCLYWQELIPFRNQMIHIIIGFLLQLVVLLLSICIALPLDTSTWPKFWIHQKHNTADNIFVVLSFAEFEYAWIEHTNNECMICIHIWTIFKNELWKLIYCI